jgi:RNA polymerase sigma factor (sigma-70 family)
MTEDELLIRLKRNDDAAFRTVYKQCLPMVVKHIRQNNGNTEDAEDLFQEALIILIQKLQEPEFELSSKLSSYLFSIVKNKWLYKLRGKKTWVEGDEVMEGLADDGQEEIQMKQEKDIKLDHLAEALKELKEDCRRILLDFYYYKKALIEIAKEMAYTEKFIRVKKSRCMDSYREIVSNKGI